MCYLSCILAQTANSTGLDKIFGISPDIFISSSVTIFITVIGFVISYFLSKKNLADEILKFKRTSQVDQTKDLAFCLCNLMCQMKDAKDPDKNLINEYAKIMNKVVAYASDDAVNIAIWGQQMNYQNNCSCQNNYAPLVALALLISQLKYDTSSVILSADKWFLLRIADYETSGMKVEIENLITKAVKNLNLNKGFCPKREI